MQDVFWLARLVSLLFMLFIAWGVYLVATYPEYLFEYLGWFMLFIFSVTILDGIKRYIDRRRGIESSPHSLLSRLCGSVEKEEAKEREEYERLHKEFGAREEYERLQEKYGKK